MDNGFLCKSCTFTMQNRLEGKLNYEDCQQKESCLVKMAHTILKVHEVIKTDPYQSSEVNR